MLRAFVIALGAFGILDTVWLGFVMRTFYRTALGPIARTGADGSLTPLWAVALPVYVLLALGEIWFVRPKIGGASFSSAIGWGAAFGLVVYGVYDLTNWATLRAYGPSIALVDIAWGMTACAIVALVLQRFA